MHISILTIGSRGDVQPYLALAIGLQKAGHKVRVASHAIFEAWIRGYNLDFSLVRFNPQDIINDPQVQKHKSNFIRFMLNVRRIMGAQFRGVFDDFWQASQGTDLILASPAAFGAYDCAEKLNIPLMTTVLQPMIPTRAFPSFFAPPTLKLGGIYNRLTHLLLEQALWHNVRPWLTPWRKEVLGLPPLPLSGPYAQMRAKRIPTLLGYSPAVIPKPADWSPWHHITGYWFLDTLADWQPPTALQHFLQAGPPPVYIGFGSMGHERPEHLTQISLDALKQTGQRGILATGWGGLAEMTLPETVFQIEAIPHDWLFPQMAAIVHHGGAGTTAASLRTGIPSIIIPFGGDQFHWGRLVSELGVAPHPLSIKKLSATLLAQAIDNAVSDASLLTKAASLGAIIRAEDGVLRAIEIIERQM